MKKIKVKQILIVVIILVVLVLGLFIYSCMKDLNKAAEEISDEILEPTFFDLPTVVGLYYEENSKWPSNIDKLKEFVLKEKLQLDLDKFKSISFLPKADGGLTVEFTTYKDYSNSEGTITGGETTGHGTLDFSPPVKEK